MAKNRNTEKIDVRLFGVGQYYKNTPYSISIAFSEQNLQYSTHPIQNDGICFVFVKSGHARLHINGELYELNAGDGYILSFSDYFDYELEKGESIRLLLCKTNIWTYLLAINCPRYQASISEITSPFALFHFTESERSAIDSIWSRQEEFAALPEALNASCKYYSFMELTGRYLRKKSY